MAKNKRRIPRRILKRPTEAISQSLDVWQADIRQAPGWVKIAGRLVRPWFMLVVNRTKHLILAHEIIESAPSAGQVWNVLARAMKKPAVGEPQLPTELHVRTDVRWDELQPRLDGIGITVVRTEDLEPLDTVFRGLALHICGAAIPGLLDMPGINSESVASFYRTASRFYRSAPWRKLGDDEAIKVECSRFESGPWYAVLMGQSGVTFGLTLYDDLTTLEKMWDCEMSDEQGARAKVALAVTFDDEMGLPVADLDAAKKFGWEVAGPDANPWIFRKEPGLSVRPPLAWELELMEGCLSAILAFLARHRPDDMTREEIVVPVASGDLSLTLSWVEA